MTQLAVLTALLVAAATAAGSALPLPGGEGGIGFDDLQFSGELHRILVPAGRTGRLDLVEPASRSVEAIEGFSRSASRERGHGEGTTSADAGENGCRAARGIALDPQHGWVFVGCDEGKAVALDASHGGRMVGTATTGGGVDSISYAPQLSHLYVPAADTATLSILAVGEHGQLDPLGTLPTAPDAHCVAADAESNVYVCDPRRGHLLVLRDRYPPSR
jgi:hypothetical protein